MEGVGHVVDSLVGQAELSGPLVLGLVQGWAFMHMFFSSMVCIVVRMIRTHSSRIQLSCICLRENVFI